MADARRDLSTESFRPTERFSDRAVRYARARPSYPPAAVDLVLEGLGDPGRVVAADVGAGTGLSARLLAERGVRVIAVEPNSAMREAAGHHPRIGWRDGKAEATGLPDGSVDLVLAAQAYHWFDEARALAEFHRILKPGGRLALLWNERDESDEFTRGYYERVFEAAGPGHRTLADWSLDPDRVAASGLFERPSLCERPNRQPLDEEGLLDRALSASYVPLSGPAHVRLVAALRDLHRRFRDSEGRVALAYRTRVWRARRIP